MGIRMMALRAAALTGAAVGLGLTIGAGVQIKAAMSY